MLNTAINKHLKTRDGLRYLTQIAKSSHATTVIETVNNAKAILTQVVNNSMVSPCTCGNLNPDVHCMNCYPLSLFDDLCISHQSEREAYSVLVSNEIFNTVYRPVPASPIFPSDDDDDFNLPF